MSSKQLTLGDLYKLFVSRFVRVDIWMILFGEFLGFRQVPSWATASIQLTRYAFLMSTSEASRLTALD
jgi:hypothetical protein